MKITFSLLICIIAVSACSNSHLTEQELKQYISNPENGLFNSKSTNGFDVTCVFRPIDQLILQELRSHTPRQRIDSLKLLYHRDLHFVLSVSRQGQDLESLYAQKASFNDVTSYLSGGIADRIFVLTESDTIAINGHVYSRMFGSTGKTSFLISVPAAFLSTSDRFSIVLDDSVLGIGTCELEFDSKDISKTPPIEF